MARPRTLTRPQEVGLLLAYVLQKLGEATVEGIDKAIHEHGTSLNKLNVHVTLARLKASAEALRARGILSMRYGDDGDEGDTKVPLYKMRRRGWEAPPEVATFAKLMPILIATVEDAALKSALDLDENSDDDSEKKGAGASRNHYRGFQTLLVGLVNEQPFHGGQPIVGNPALEQAWKRSPFRPEGTHVAPQVVTVRKVKVLDYGVDLVFERAHDGRLFIHAGVVRGWIGSICYHLGYSSEGMRVLVGTPGIYIEPKQPLLVEQRPLNANGDGVGMARYETLQPGEDITFLMRVPTEGHKAPSLEEWQNLLAWGCRFAPRHLSPARGRMTGACRLARFGVVSDDSLVLPEVQEITLDEVTAYTGFNVGLT